MNSTGPAARRGRAGTAAGLALSRGTAPSPMLAPPEPAAAFPLCMLQPLSARCTLAQPPLVGLQDNIYNLHSVSWVFGAIVKAEVD